MRYAIVNNERAMPSPGMTGSCPVCRSAVIARCGSVRVHHWAHRGERVCDVWWESRTAWHCNWQDQFPKSWQEVTRSAVSGEKHIADIHTERGLTIEFQYSHLKPEERTARESFYANMAWVVSGARLSGDLPRFLHGRRFFIPIWKKGVHITARPEIAFPHNWLGCTVPVFFDFGDAASLIDTTMPITRPLWCLLPHRVFGMAIVVRVSRDAFVRWAWEREHLLPMHTIVEGVAQVLAIARVRQAQIARQRAVARALHQRRTWKPRRFNKRLPRF